MFTTHLFRFRWIIRNLKVIGPTAQHQKRNKSSSFPPQLPSSLAMELLLHQLIPGPSGNWLQQNAGKFELPRLFHGSGWTTDPPKKKIRKITYVWQTNPQTPPFNFGKIRLRLIQQKTQSNWLAVPFPPQLLRREFQRLWLWFRLGSPRNRNPWMILG